ncbi:hypothetical protein ACET3Z_016932 [Daucus carota]
MCDQQPKKRMKSLFSFYKKGSDIQAPASNIHMDDQPGPALNSLPASEVEIPADILEEQCVKTDPGLRKPICKFPVNQQDRIRKEYIQLGPCQPKLENYPPTFDPLVDILIRLVLTLPVSTATTERAFSAMKIIKTRLRNKMEDGYLSSCMMLHIEKEYVDDIDSEAVIDHFESTGDRRAQFK